MDPKDNPTETPATPATPAAPTETPSFMSGIVDPTEDQVKARDVLSGDGPGDEETPTPGTETPQPGTETPEGGTPAADPGTETPQPGTETPTPGTEPAKPGEGEPAKTEEPAKPTPQDEERQRQETITRGIDRRIKATQEIDQHIQNMIGRPLVKLDAPNPEQYKDKDGSFDIQTYVQDYMGQIVVALQKSLVGGSLGAIQFGVLKQAIQEEGSERLNAIKADENAKSIWDKLSTKFPILKKDEAVGTRFERAIYGEKSLRARKAQAEGKQYVDLSFEDYEKLAIDVIGGQPSPAAPAPNPTEALPGSPQIGGSTKGKDPVGDDIDAMVGLKQKRGVLF